MKRKVSVVVPVFNGIDTIGRLLERIYSQDVDFDVEILISDSGSTDGTAHFLRDEAESGKIRLIELDNKDYGHGKTRNLLAQEATGEFIVYLVQDALPAGNTWLQAIINGFDADQNIVALFCRHRANPNANPVHMRLIKKTFDDYYSRIEKLPSAVKKGELIYFTDKKDIKEWDSYLAFSNVAAAYRRSELLEIKFRDVDFAEDRYFMMDSVNRGYYIGFLNESFVYHSHDFGYWKTLQKTYDEWEAIAKTGSYPYKFRAYNILTHGARGYVRAMEYVLKNPLPLSIKLIAPISALLMEISIKLGMYFGLNHKKLPKSLRKVLSHQLNWRKTE